MWHVALFLTLTSILSILIRSRFQYSLIWSNVCTPSASPSLFWLLTFCYLVPSMIKAHFSWTWQCTTLNQGNELANLLLVCIQPHQLSILDFWPNSSQNFGHSCPVFGVLSMYHETKVPKPGVSLILSSMSLLFYWSCYTAKWTWLQFCAPPLWPPPLFCGSTCTSSSLHVW